MIPEAGLPPILLTTLCVPHIHSQSPELGGGDDGGQAQRRLVSLLGTRHPHPTLAVEYLGHVPLPSARLQGMSWQASVIV